MQTLRGVASIFIAGFTDIMNDIVLLHEGTEIRLSTGFLHCSNVVDFEEKKEQNQLDYRYRRFTEGLTRGHNLCADIVRT